MPTQTQQTLTFDDKEWKDLEVEVMQLYYQRDSDSLMRLFKRRWNTKELLNIEKKGEEPNGSGNQPAAEPLGA